VSNGRSPKAAANGYKDVVDRVLKHAKPIVDEFQRDSFVDEIVVELRHDPITVLEKGKRTKRKVNFPKEPGLYLFEINLRVTPTAELLTKFGNKWNTDRIQAGTSPRFYPGKVNKALTARDADWVPFYLGKEENIKKRVSQHIAGPNNKKTSALRLQDNATLFKEADLRVGYAQIAIPKDLHFLLGLIEKAVRSRLNPIVGRQ